MTTPVGETPAQAYLRVVGDRSTARTRAVFDLAGKLTMYRSARAVLNGRALADWTERYEGDLRDLVTLAIDSLNDLFDTGSWPRIVSTLSIAQTIKAEDLIQRVQTAVATDFGAQAGEAIAVAKELLAGATIETAPSANGVRITVLRDGQQPAALELTSQTVSGARPRVSSTAFLAGRPPLAVQRRTRGDYSARAPKAIDAYGTAIDLFDALLANARREVRASGRYGRVRVQGNALWVILIVVIAVAIGASIGYAIECTGSNEGKNQDACNVLGALSLVAWVLALILGSGAAVKGSGPSSVDDYNLNPPPSN